MRLLLVHDLGNLIAISISDEKPLHMRLTQLDGSRIYHSQFQSQMRSRSTCDTTLASPLPLDLCISISDEKPLHMRRISTPCRDGMTFDFNLR